MFYTLDVVCSQLNFGPIVAAVVAVFFGMASLTARRFGYVPNIIITSLLTVTTVLLFVVVIFVILDTTCILPNAKSAFKEDYEIPTIKCYVQRKTDVDDFIQRIQSKNIRLDGYYFLEGVHGCGKSTSIQTSLLPYSESGIAHLYLQVTSTKDLTDRLYSKLKITNYCESWWSTIRSFMKVPSPACPDEPAARFKYALDILTLAATEINKEDGFPPLVVFDNMAQIMKTPDDLEIIRFTRLCKGNVRWKIYDYFVCIE